ncbi:MAG: hypothetical protein FGF53_04815 [Candidatus Brockarchaeota archaeon]|nr:hypothetical protein [Candidatus Brockarchaeota archaeon]MBO3808764.1 hypothetical protein [Candidatus Brockarchaeota archaeon]
MAEKGMRVSMDFLRRMLDYLWKGKYKLEDLSKLEGENSVSYSRKNGKVDYMTLDAVKNDSGMFKAWHFWAFPQVYGSENGTIKIISDGIVGISDYLGEAVYSLFKRKLTNARREKNKEEEKMLIKEWIEKGEEIWRDLVEGRSFKCIKDKRLKRLALHVKYAKEVARKVSRKYGVEVTYYRKPYDDFDYFCSVFNARGMSEDQIFEEIKKRVEAINEAKYHYFPYGYKITDRCLSIVHKKLYGEQKSQGE